MRLDYAVDYVLERLPRRVDQPFAEDVDNGLAEVLEDGRAEIVDGWIVKKGALPPRQDAAEATKPVRRSPGPKTPVEGCVDQRVHLDAIWSATKLKGNPSVLLCALALQRAYGRKQKTAKYGKPLRHGLDLIAADAGVSRATAKRAMAVVVECGLFARVDRGFGRQGGGGVATWEATIPRWFRG